MKRRTAWTTGWTTGVKVVLALGVMGFLVHVVDPAAIAAAAAGARPGWIVAAAALLPVNMGLQGVVWFWLLRPVVPGVRFGPAFGALLAGHTLGIVTPAHAGDFVGRAYYLPGVDRWEVSAVVLVHRLLEMTPCMVCGAAALWYYIATTTPAPLPVWKGLAVAGAVLALGMTILALAPRPTHRLLRRLLRTEPARRRVAFLGRIGPRTMLGLLAGVFAGYVVFTTQFFWLLRAFSPGAPVLAGFLGIALVYFVKYLIPAVTFLDVGIREGAAVFFLGSLGFAGAAAFNAALLLFAINLLLPALAGLPLLFRLRLGRSRPPGGPPAARPTSSNQPAR